MRRRGGGRFFAMGERIEVLALQFGQFPDGMPFAGSENNDQAGERRERRKPRTKHERGKSKGQVARGATKRLESDEWERHTRCMRRPVPFRTTTLIVLIGLSFSSCQTAPPPAKASTVPAKTSPAQERYKKLVEDRLGPLWYRLTEVHADSLQLGTIVTIFEIPAGGGQVRNLRVTSNTGGRMDELIARRAIDQLRAPPVPPEILAQLHQDYMVFEESFTIFEKR